VESGTASAYPFLFGGAQLDPTGYYGNFNPALVHSVSGGAVPYTGADAPDFGSMGGRVRLVFQIGIGVRGREGVDAHQEVAHVLHGSRRESAVAFQG
jgi:hypothetical protein